VTRAPDAIRARLIKPASRSGSAGEFRYLLCDEISEIFHGSCEIRVSHHGRAREAVRL